MQQVLGRGGETRLKVRKEGDGNKSRRAGWRSDELDTKAVVQRTTRMYPNVTNGLSRNIRNRPINRIRLNTRLNWIAALRISYTERVV